MNILISGLRGTQHRALSRITLWTLSLEASDPAVIFSSQKSSLFATPELSQRTSNCRTSDLPHLSSFIDNFPQMRSLIYQNGVSSEFFPQSASGEQSVRFSEKNAHWGNPLWADHVCELQFCLWFHICQAPREYQGTLGENTWGLLVGGHDTTHCETVLVGSMTDLGQTSTWGGWVGLGHAVQLTWENCHGTGAR